MTKFKNIVDQRFGRLITLKRAEDKSKQQYAPHKLNNLEIK